VIAWVPIDRCTRSHHFSYVLTSGVELLRFSLLRDLEDEDLDQILAEAFDVARHTDQPVFKQVFNDIDVVADLVILVIEEQEKPISDDSSHDEDCCFEFDLTH
jgi:hypothetical protein